MRARDGAPEIVPNDNLAQFQKLAKIYFCKRQEDNAMDGFGAYWYQGLQCKGKAGVV